MKNVSTLMLVDEEIDNIVTEIKIILAHFKMKVLENKKPINLKKQINLEKEKEIQVMREIKESFRYFNY